ncbi:MAG: tRNA lysidine(34) synthetase TilS C-terminal domain-containing protein [Bacillota bacterium]
MDEKVSPLERDRIPILLSGDEIIWVAGVPDRRRDCGSP